MEEERQKREALRVEALKFEQERILYIQRKEELENFERQRQDAVKREQEDMERKIQEQRQQMMFIEQQMKAEREKALEEMRQASIILQQQVWPFGCLKISPPSSLSHYSSRKRKPRRTAGGCGKRNPYSHLTCVAETDQRLPPLCRTLVTNSPFVRSMEMQNRP